MVKARENRVPMMLSDEELNKIDDWRFANRIGTRSEAIRRLCQIGMILEERLQNLRSLAESAHSAFDSSDASLLRWTNGEWLETEETEDEIQRMREVARLHSLEVSHEVLDLIALSDAMRKEKSLEAAIAAAQKSLEAYKLERAEKAASNNKAFEAMFPNEDMESD